MGGIVCIVVQNVLRQSLCVLLVVPWDFAKELGLTLPFKNLVWVPSVSSQGLFARRRQLLLTEGPHLYYVDPVNKVLKGEIPWSLELRPEAKNFKTFFVHTVSNAASR